VSDSEDRTTESATAGPDQKDVVSAAADLIIARGFPEAIVLLRSQLVDDPDDAELNYLLGVAAYRFGDAETARDAFERTVLTDSSHTDGHLGLGLVARQLGRPDLARRSFLAALRSDTGNEAALRYLAELEVEATTPAASTSGSPSPSTSGPDVPKTVTPLSLAERLDARDKPRPDESVMAGVMLWSGQPSARSLVGPVLAAITIVLLPRPFHDLASALPNGIARTAAAAFWHLVEALCWPAAFAVLAVMTARMLTRRFVVRKHRAEVFTGILRRAHVAIWLHDLERPVIVRQNLWYVALGLGTIQLDSTMLPSRRSRRWAGRPGRMVMSGLPIGVAEGIGGLIRAESLWQRRRMIGNFVSSR
jgi:hypothetical protein